MRRDLFSNYTTTRSRETVLSFSWILLSLTKLPLILYNGNSTTEWKGIIIAALTCHWPAEDEGNNLTLSGVLWQTPARVPKCPEPPEKKPSNKTVKDLADDTEMLCFFKMYISRWRRLLNGFTDTKVNYSVPTSLKLKYPDTEPETIQQNSGLESVVRSTESIFLFFFLLTTL